MLILPLAFSYATMIDSYFRYKLKNRPLINKDFKPHFTPSSLASRVSKKLNYSLLILIAASLSLLVYILLPSSSDLPERLATNDNTVPLAIPAVENIETKKPSIQQTSSHPTTKASETRKPVDIAWSKHTIKAGDNLAVIFSDIGLSAQLLHKIIHSGPIAKQLQNIKPGQQLRVSQDDASGLFKSLEYDIDRSHTIRINSRDSIISAAIDEKAIDKVQVTANAEINNSLYFDGKKAGLSDRTIMELANIFGWDIDFALNIREGDRFTVLYNAQYINGERIEDGKILAAEFSNRGHTFQAVRFEYAGGKSEYFSPSGKSMRKSFLRSPIEFARISSRFNLRRKHPVLNRIRAHRGVDYAAASGTPIKTTGDGRIIFRGVKGGFGRVVIVKHGEKYNTLYAHMSKYGRYKKGTFVKQGQTIGYVGKSGLATGPHLHYEFRINGVHRNPLTVKFPAAKPISKKLLATFMQQTNPLLTKLEQSKATYLAANSAQATK